MLKAYAMKYFDDIVMLLATVSSDMLLLLKTNDCLRHIDRALGEPLNTVTIGTIIVITWKSLHIVKNPNYFLLIFDHIVAETVADVILKEDVSAIFSSTDSNEKHTTTMFRKFVLILEAGRSWFGLMVRVWGLRITNHVLKLTKQLHFGR